MKLALFADIHSNLEAITACLAHAQALGAERYAFLGDLVGYGADPGAVLDLIASGFFEPEHPEIFRPMVQALLDQDTYMLLADFQSYVECQERVAKAFLDPDQWTRMAILNIAHMGKFSSDRSIREYAEQIWGARGVPG